jgi:nucleotide-binding universal stress UspA family protein
MIVTTARVSDHMLATILVPLDGSQLAEQALPYAERLAEATSARVVLSRVLPLAVLERPEADLESADQARAYLQGVADRLTSKGRVVEATTPWADPASEILEQVGSTHADLVVMATHGRSGPGRWLYGSVADEILRRAPVPVILVPPHVAAPWPTDRAPCILVPLDGSRHAEAALGPAEELAAKLGSEIVLLQVVVFPPYSLYGDGSAYLAAFDPDVQLKEAREYLDALAKRLTVSRVRVVVELGQPAFTIAEIAQREKVDLIAMATHGRSGLARLVLGSVATGTLQRASVPLMLVRPAALPASVAPVAAAPEPATPPAPPGPVVTVPLSAADRDLLQRGLGELLYKPEADPQLGSAVRDLQGRLKSTEGAAAR